MNVNRQFQNQQITHPILSRTHSPKKEHVTPARKIDELKTLLSPGLKRNTPIKQMHETESPYSKKFSNFVSRKVGSNTKPRTELEQQLSNLSISSDQRKQRSKMSDVVVSPPGKNGTQRDQAVTPIRSIELLQDRSGLESGNKLARLTVEEDHQEKHNISGSEWSQEQSLVRIYEESDRFYQGFVDELDGLMITKKAWGVQNTHHEQLLMEENYYLRERLIEMSERIQDFKSKIQDDIVACWRLTQDNSDIQNELIESKELIRKYREAEAASSEQRLALQMTRNQQLEKQIKEMEAETKELRNSDKERFQEVKGIILNLEEQLEDKCRILQTQQRECFKHEKEIKELTRDIQQKTEEIAELSAVCERMQRIAEQEIDKRKQIELYTQQLEEENDQLRALVETSRLMNETDRSMHSIVRDKSERGEQETISLSILDADILKNIIERKEKKYEEEINELRTNQEVLKKQYEELLESMTKKIRKMQRKMQPSDNVDDELEELLENCVSQLESERALTFKLKEELYNCQRMIKDLTVRMKEPKSMRSIEDEKSQDGQSLMYKKTSKFIDFMPEFPTKRTLGRFPKTNKKCTDDLNNSVETITMRKIVRL